MAGPNTTTANLTTVSNILKEFYLPPVVEQLNNNVLLLNRLEKRDQELYGNEAVVPLHTKRSSGIGPAAEDGALPAAGAQGYAKAVYDLKYLYGRLRVTGPSMEKTKKEAGSFLQVLKSEIDGLRQDLQQDLSRQVYGAGDGKIATCGVTTAAAAVVLSSAEAIRKGFLYVGMKIDVGTAADSDSLIDGEEILSYSISAKTITVTTAITTTASNFVFRHDSCGGGASTACLEIAGIQQIVASAATSFGGINPATAGNEYWDNMRDTSTSTLSSDALVQNMNQVAVAGGEISAMVSTPGMQRKLFGLLQSQVRYVNTTDIHGGFKALDFNGQPFIADRHAPFGQIFLLDERFLKVFANRDWHWLDEDGDILKWVVGYDAWEAVLARYMNLGTTRRNTHLVMSNLSGDDPNGF